MTGVDFVLEDLSQTVTDLKLKSEVMSIRIILTSPVAFAESFSQLKLIKNYLRSTISQERLVGLSTISIESELCREMDFSDVIDIFASLRASSVV